MQNNKLNYYLILCISLILFASCNKSKEADIIPEDTYSYEVECNYCDISYINSANEKKEIKNNIGKWEYKFNKKVTFDLKIDIKTNLSSSQTIHLYILKNKDIVFGSIGYNTASLVFNTQRNNGTSSYGSYRNNGSDGNSNGGGNTKPTSSVCGAKNKTGGYCKRLVSGGGRCWQHK